MLHTIYLMFFLLSNNICNVKALNIFNVFICLMNELMHYIFNAINI